MNIDQAQVGQDQGRRWFPVLSQNLQLWPTSFWAHQPKNFDALSCQRATAALRLGTGTKPEALVGKGLCWFTLPQAIWKLVYTSDVKKEKQKEKSNNVEHTRLVLPHVLHSLFFLPTFNWGNCLSFLSVDVFYTDKRFDSSHLCPLDQKSWRGTLHGAMPQPSSPPGSWALDLLGPKCFVCIWRAWCTSSLPV